MARGEHPPPTHTHNPRSPRLLAPDRYLIPMNPTNFLLAALLLITPLVAQTQPAQTPSPTDPTTHAALHLPTPANPALPTIFLVGDSTVRNGKGDGAHGQWGWGEPLAALFDPAPINVVNRAIGGRSSRTYITEGHWTDTLALIKPGDVVLVQIGHNDGGIPDEPTRARASLPGTGDGTLEIDNPILKRHETVHTFGWYMTKYVNDTRSKGAIPIICSLVPRKTWKDGKVVRNNDNYAGWARQVAERENVPFLDLNNLIADRYDTFGEATVEPLFADPHTHTSLAGAQLNAEIVVSALKGLPSDPVAEDFSAAGKAIQAARLRR